MDLKKGITVRHYHISFALVIIIFLIILLILTLKPAFIGYKLNKEFENLGTNAAEFLRNQELLKSRILILETDLKNCNRSNQDYLKQITNEKNATFSCLEEKRKIQSEFDIIKNEYEYNLSRITAENEQRKSKAELELNQLKIQYEELESMYNLIVSNAADNICCKNKIDNPEIDSYFISNNKIICSVGEENKISC